MLVELQQCRQAGVQVGTGTVRSRAFPSQLASQMLVFCSIIENFDRFQLEVFIVPSN